MVKKKMTFLFLAVHDEFNDNHIFASWYVALCFSVGRNLRRRNPFRANAYRFPAEEDNIDWVEYRFRLVIQKMVVVILILLIVLLFQLYPVKKQQ